MSVEQSTVSLPTKRDPRETLIEAERTARKHLLTIGTRMAEVYIDAPKDVRIFPEDTPEYLDAAKRLADAHRAVDAAFAFHENTDL